MSDAERLLKAMKLLDGVIDAYYDRDAALVTAIVREATELIGLVANHTTGVRRDS